MRDSSNIPLNSICIRNPLIDETAIIMVSYNCIVESFSRASFVRTTVYDLRAAFKASILFVFRTSSFNLACTSH